MYSEVIVADTAIVTLRLEGGLRKQLDRLAKAQRRSRSFVAAQAIRDYVALNEWQVAEIEEALREADAGEFATPAEVNRVITRFSGQRRKSPKPSGPKSRARRA